MEAYDINYLFLLYLYPEKKKEKTLWDIYEVGPGEGRRPNLASEFTGQVAAKLAMGFVPDGWGNLETTFGPEDVFHYMYAVFHSPAYRVRYAEFLKIDFPRLPLTGQPELFRKLCRLGRELTGLHLLESHPTRLTHFPLAGTNMVEIVRYTPPGQPNEKDPGRVWINSLQYFEGVLPDVWEFQVGGYQVCQKWLKDRKGRALSYDDIQHYHSIVAALSETIRLKAEIDTIIEDAGGWPLT